MIGSESGTKARGRAAAPGGDPQASPGLPAPRSGSAERRLEDLEARLARLEDVRKLRRRGRTLLDKVVPPEATHHFRTAGREQLLGVRSIVDFWIRRLDAMEGADDPGSTDRETIEID